MKSNDLEFSLYFLSHNLGISIEEVEKMELTRVKKWLQYFSIVNGTAEEKPTDENNVAGFMQHLQGAEK